MPARRRLRPGSPDRPYCQLASYSSLRTIDRGPWGRDAARRCAPCLERTRAMDLDDVGTSLGIEKLRAAKMVEEGLAVVAVAHDPVNGVGRDTCDQPANLAAATGQRNVPAHFLLRGAVAGAHRDLSLHLVRVSRFVGACGASPPSRTGSPPSARKP